MIQETTQLAQEAASAGAPWSQPLSSGFVGALGVFLLGAIGSGLRRRRERIALMKLVHMEIMHNELVIGRLSEAENPFDTGHIASLKDEAWRENRAQLTQLEAERAVEYLGMYYTSVGTVLAAYRLYKETDDAALLSDVDDEVLKP